MGKESGGDPETMGKEDLSPSRRGDGFGGGAIDGSGRHDGIRDPPPVKERLWGDSLVRGCVKNTVILFYASPRSLARRSV